MSHPLIQPPLPPSEPGASRSYSPSLCLSVCWCYALITGVGSGAQVSGGKLLIISNLLCFKYHASTAPQHQIVDSATQSVPVQPLFLFELVLSLASPSACSAPWHDSCLPSLSCSAGKPHWISSVLPGSLDSLRLAPLCQFPCLAQLSSPTPARSLGFRLPASTFPLVPLHQVSALLWP